MAATHDLGTFYWTTIRYGAKPPIFVERAETQEIDEPFRRGEGWAFRIPLTTKAVVLGKWLSQAVSESHALTYAIGGRILKDSEIDWDLIRGLEDES